MSHPQYYLPQGYAVPPASYPVAPVHPYPGQTPAPQMQGYGQAGYPLPQGQAIYGMGYAQTPAACPANPGYAASPALGVNLTSNRFLKGLIIGGAAAYLLTNEQVQQSAIKGVVKVWTLLQGGVAELKERFHDAEAEIRANGMHPE